MRYYAKLLRPQVTFMRGTATFGVNAQLATLHTDVAPGAQKRTIPQMDSTKEPELVQYYVQELSCIKERYGA